MEENIATIMCHATSQATKAALTRYEVFSQLDEAGIVRSEKDQELVRDTLTGLVQLRLLRSFERQDIALYELAHDHLATEISTWISQSESQAKLARELLRSETDNWRAAGLLIRPEILALIYERRMELKRINSNELELLFRSALDAGREAAYWAERARDGGIDVDAIALNSLESPHFPTRRVAIAILGQIGDRFLPSIVKQLDDVYPQVRIAAINALVLCKFNY